VTDGTVELRFEDDRALIRLARPEVANALDPAMVAAFEDAVEGAAGSGAAVTVVTGAGPRFCGGGDIHAFVGAEDRAATVEKMAIDLGRAMGKLAQLPMPVVVGVQGAVSGGGLAFLLHADVVVAAASTKFSLGYSAIAVTPDCGVSYWLPRVVGQLRALDLAVTGRTLSAVEAESWGLVSRTVPDEQLEQAIDEVAARCASYPASVLAQTRRLMRESWSVDRDTSVADETRTITGLIVAPEADERLRRFTERRPG
jgi:2-(1,2-epoxy-1,2-dihydrophenyl)acetyl-CoA isomerase